MTGADSKVTRVLSVRFAARASWMDLFSQPDCMAYYLPQSARCPVYARPQLVTFLTLALCLRHAYDCITHGIDWSNHLPECMGNSTMSNAKQASKQRRRRKAVPVLGVAGLSLSLASGVSVASGSVATDMPTRGAGISHEITLGEEEIFDVSLATFYVSDKETPGTLPPGVQVAGACSGGCGCGCGCGCCGGAAEIFYRSGMLGNYADPPQQKPAHKYTHARKRTHVPKNP